MRPRWLGPTRGFAALAWALTRVSFWLATKPDSPASRRHERAFFARIAKGFRITIAQQGEASRAPGTLFVMNHISWADIPVMMTLLDADFVAKADIAGWPVIGALARRFNPVFVTRGERHRSLDQADAIRARLRSGRSVILCAEGTTSDGAGILPFRTSLLAAADAAQVIQPVVLRYLSPNGGQLTPQRQRDVAWIDDDELFSGAARLAREATLALVSFLSPVPCSDRKALATQLLARMLQAYAAAPNRPR